MTPRWLRGICCTILLSATHMALPSEAAAQAPRPNFIIFFTDDQGYNDVQCYGSPRIKTPNLDRLAREGTRFTSFYAQNVCGPSRAALLTGSYPIRCGEPGNRKNPHTVLHPRELTIAELLKTRNYATACIGKWHVAGGGGIRKTASGQFVYGPRGRPSGRGPFERDLMPNSQGFDYFFGTPAHNGSRREPQNDRYVTILMRQHDVVEDPVDMNSLTRRYTEEAIGFMRENQERPFFLYLAHTMPHVPLGVSPRFRGKSKGGLYGDTIEELDWSMGEILRTLEELEIDERTLILYTSDNGPWVEKHLAGKGGLDAHYGSADPLRGSKMTTWEGGPRVPGIVRWPGNVPAGRVGDRMITTLDVLPTFARLAGARLPRGLVIDGLDLSEFILGQRDDSEREDFLYYSSTHLQAVRLGNWKLVLPRPAKPKWTAWYARMIEAIGAPQLYNLAKDIGEKHDMASQHPEVVKRLMARAEKARRELGDYDRIGIQARFFDDGPPRVDSEKWRN